MLQRAAWVPYAAAVALVVVATLARLSLNPLWGAKHPFIFFLLVILISAVYLGFRPGLLALVLSLFASAAFVIPPTGSLATRDPADALALLAFLTIGALVILIGHRQNHAVREAEAHARRAVQESEERSRAEAALRELEERQRIALALTSDYTFTFSRDKPEDPFKLAVSEGYEIITGYKEEELQSREARLGHIHPEDRPLLANFLKDLEQKGTVELEYRVISKNGAVRWLHMHAQALRNEGGSILKIVGAGEDITIRKQSDETIQRLADIVRSSEDAIFSLGEGKKIQSWNPAAERLYGYTAAEVLGQSAELLVPESHRQELSDLWNRVLAGEHVSHFETVRVRKDGAQITVSASVAPVKSARGEVVGASIIARDITAKREQEEALKLQARVLESMTEGVSLSDENGFILYTNPAEDEIFGYERGELVGQHVSIQNTYSEDENKQIVGEVIEHLKAKGVWFGEFSNKKKDATPLTTYARISTLHLNGRPCFVCVQEDITDRKRADEALHQSQERLKLALDAGKMGIWDWNVQANELVWSEQLEAIHGMKPGSFDGTFESFLAVVHEEDRELLLKSIGDALQTGQDFLVEFRVRRHDGEIGWVTGIGKAFLDEHGHPSRMVGVGRDITGQKRAELEIQALNADLEARVQQRTAELQQANDELAGFTYSIAHDMRTYLRSMSIASRTLIEDYPESLDADGEDSLRSIIRNAKQASQLVDGLLEFTRVGRHEIEKEDVDLTAMAEEIKDILTEAVFPREISYEFEPGLVAWGDPRLLRVVLVNLLENASKYHPRSGTGVVRLRRLEDIDGLSQFCVEDNGVGFDSSFMHKLFKPFERLHRDSDFPGNGIGLANVRRILDKHGGRIWAETELGKGSTFYFALPKKEQLPTPVEELHEVAGQT
jgi:PAS domain S-box-containing protein